MAHRPMTDMSTAGGAEWAGRVDWTREELVRAARESGRPWGQGIPDFPEPFAMPPPALRHDEQIKMAREHARLGDFYGPGIHPFDIPPRAKEVPAEEVVMRLRCGDIRNYGDIRDYAVLLERGTITKEMHELNREAKEVREMVWSTFREDVFLGAGGVDPGAPWPLPGGARRAAEPVKDRHGSVCEASTRHWLQHGKKHVLTAEDATPIPPAQPIVLPAWLKVRS